jgi:hypothetical protein
MFPLKLAFATAALLAGCARTEKAEERQVGEAANQAAQLNGAAGEADGLTKGAWAVGSEASFEGASGAIELVIRCDQRRGLIIQRPGLVPRGQLALLQLRTGGVVRRLAVTAPVGGSAGIEAVVPYNDQLIEPLMRFDDPLEVRFAGLDTLQLPPSWQVAGFVRDCQNAAPLDGNAAANAATNAG